MTRLRRTAFHIAAGDMPAPFAESRHNLDDKRTWIIDEKLIAHWMVQPGMPVVYIPRVLLANAGSRDSVETFLHAMALVHGFVPRGVSVTKRLDDKLVAILDKDAITRFVGGSPRSHTLHRVLGEIPDEFDKDLMPWAETMVEVSSRVIRSPKYPRGRFMSANITVIHHPIAEIEARATGAETWMVPVRTSVPGWEQKQPRPRHLRKPARSKAPAPIAAVVPLPDPFSEPEPVRYADIGPVDSDADIDF